MDALSALLAGKADVQPLMRLNRTDTKASADAYTTAGMYWINPSITTDIPEKQWGFLRVFADSDVILQEFYAALSGIHGYRVYVNGGWQSWNITS